TIKIPVAVDNQRHQDQTPESALQNQRVLVVDDSRTARGVISNYLERWRIEVFNAATAAEAKILILHQAKLGQPIDIAIVDYRLPDASGLDLVGTLINENRLPQVPAVIITSNVTSIIEPQRARNYGVHHILEKPVLAETLKLVLLENLYLKRSFKEGLDNTLEGPGQGANSQGQNGERVEKRVLVVEDDPVSASVTAGCLRALNLGFDLANTAKQALQLERDHDYDLVLMDCTLPDQSGFEVARQIRARHHQQRSQSSRERALQIVALTADDSNDFRRLSAEAGMDEHLLKPITLANLQILTR
ncbi:MAG: response regulator, partial [Gammaproteobacteria bacterium]|nr:response regulator [Gammaproteobacteria bacterium]